VPLARLGVAQALLACGRVKITDIDIDALVRPDTATANGSTAADGGQAASTEAPRQEDPPMSDEIDEALVLHTLRVRGFVTPDGFRESIGDHPGELLAELVADGKVRHIEKRDMYGLLPPGKEHQESLLDAYAGADVQAALQTHYERFLELNDVFKQLCTDWQMRDGEQNDHGDTDYDAAVIGRLVALNDDARPTLDGFTAGLARMGRYAGRLDEALGKLQAGETNLFTGVMCSSYHDVWMELHEDLIVLQRIDRVAEGSF
jgi:hypothetical protein